MKIVFAASECVPFAKTGGLADVIGALPKALASGKGLKDQDSVAVILPKYGQIDEKKFPLTLLPGKIRIPIGSRIETGFVWTLDPKKKIAQEISGGRQVTYYFIENKKYFHRSSLYRAADGKDFADNDERFIFYARAVLETCKFVNFAPDIVHAHDWQSGLLPAYLKTLYKLDSFFHRTASLFTIHNIAYQGVFPKETHELAGFSWEDFIPEKFEYYDQINFLKSGIVFADKISTVSPTYCKEVQAGEEAGRGMEGILKTRSKDFEGILNGLDYGYWDPASDPFLAARFSAKSKNLSEAKKACKAELQKIKGLPVDEDSVVIGMVSRLDPQKGFRQVLEILPKMAQADKNIQWVILGSGERDIQDALAMLGKKFPKQIAVDFTFNEPFAHQIYAGSDLFFMPSEFEPCGLSQMIAMRYASIPVVTPTGGLKDTVESWNSARGKGNGFVSADLTSESLLFTLEEAIEATRSPARIQKLISNAMAAEFSWAKSAEKYKVLYRAAIAAQSRNEALAEV